MKKTIYIPEGFDWVGLEVRARDANLSVSQYLLGGSMKFDFKSGPGMIPDQLDRIEGKIDALLPATGRIGQSSARGTPIYGDGVSSVKAEKTMRGDMVVPFNPQPKKGGK